MFRVHTRLLTFTTTHTIQEEIHTIVCCCDPIHYVIDKLTKPYTVKTESIKAFG